MFSFNNVINIQRYGVSMGAALGPILKKCDYDRNEKENIATTGRVRKIKHLHEISR